MGGIALFFTLAGLVISVMVVVAVLNTSHRVKLMLDQSKLQTKLLQHLAQKQIGDGE